MWSGNYPSFVKLLDSLECTKEHVTGKNTDPSEFTLHPQTHTHTQARTHTYTP